MSKQLYIVNSQVILAFDRNKNIRTKVFEYEEALKKHFKIPFRTYAFPDELDANYPRFESASLNGHSKIHVSQNRLTFATKYSDNYRPDIKQIRKYISERVNIFKDLIKSEKIQYIAYIIEMGFELPSENINDFLKEHTGVFAIEKNCIDFNLHYSFEYKSKYFLNVRNSKFVEEKYILDKTQSLTKDGKSNYGIGVTLDLNTKFLYLSGKEFVDTLYDQTEKETFKLINEKKIKDYLGGELIK